MKPKVSVIVPVYNTESYLTRCLESILAQTLDDIEILILLDNKSNDNSSIIAAYFKTIDRRVRVFQTTVSGANAVRNIGILHALGEYVGFVDSDDYIEPEMYAQLYCFAHEHSLDVCITGISRDTGEEQLPQTQIEYPQEKRTLDHYSKKSFLYKWVLSSHANSACNKIYRKTFLKAYQLTFNEQIQIGEDADFNARAFTHAHSAGSVSSAPYIYFNRTSSVMHSVNNVHALQDFQLRWNTFQRLAPLVDNGGDALAIASIRLVANALNLFKIRGYSLQEACRFASLVVEKLNLMEYLNRSLLPGLIEEFGFESGMSESSTQDFKHFATAIVNGEQHLLKWQLKFAKKG